MASIRSKDTTPELIVRRSLHQRGMRYRIHSKKLPGKPDISIGKYSLIVNIKGCFWHDHENCKLSTKPKTNTDYWLPKIQRNRERDITNQFLLQELGYKVYTIWECETKDRFQLNSKIDSIESYIKGHTCKVSTKTMICN